MAFFSGYPLVYAIVQVISGYFKGSSIFKNRMISLLPVSYVLVGILFLGLQLKKLYPDYSIDNIISETQNPFLAFWGILAILFFLPFLRKKVILSLLHSLVFFFLVLKNIFLYVTSTNADENVLKNSMNVYTTSLALNFSILSIVLLTVSAFNFFRKKAA